MDGDLTRSKSNKGSLDGQFSHEFLHRPVERWRFAGLCADLAASVQFYQAWKVIFCTREPRWLARVPQQQQDCPARGSKFRPARPQRAKTRDVPLGYVEGLNDARTPLANFFSLLLFRHEDQHPWRAFFDHVRKPSSGTTGGDSWKDGASANLNGAETVGGGLRREQGEDSRDFSA